MQTEGINSNYQISTQQEQKMREIITAINKLENENPANLPEGLNKLQDSLCSYFDEDIEL